MQTSKKSKVMGKLDHIVLEGGANNDDGYGHTKTVSNLIPRPTRKPSSFLAWILFR